MHFVRYSAVGIINTIVGYGTILLLHSLASLGTYLANAGGYLVGLSVSFILNRSWTFAKTRASDRSVSSEVIKFVAVFVIAYGVQLATLWAVSSYLALPFFLDQFFSMVVYVIVGFIGNRYWTFAGNTEVSDG